MTRIYLIRHGETEYNQRGCYYGWTDCSLNEKGIIQGRALGKAFETIPLDAVVSSDLKRAVETASLLKDCRRVLDHRLRELNFGFWEGKHHQEIMESYKEHWEQWASDWMHAAPTEGESFHSMYLRIKGCMEELLATYKDKNIAIVSHNGPLRIITAYLLELPLEKVWSFDFMQGRYSLLELWEDHCTIRAINII